jgi:gliding motility-associated-like protein
MKTKWAFAPRALLVLLFFIILSNRLTAQLRADFTATPLSGCAPLFVSFKDASTWDSREGEIGKPNYWKWNLGNGTVSYLQNPSTTYFTPGMYTIKLVVKNASGTADSMIKTQYIIVNSLPTPSFKASDTVGCYPLNVQFTDESIANEGDIVRWEWDLGDGTLSTLKNPEHTYLTAGSYNVILRVTNAAGCVKTISKQKYIKINGGAVADFSFVTSNLCSPPAVVNFTNNSTGTGILSYKWDFGNGTTSTNANPSNTYLNAGKYTVQLITTNNAGCADTLIKTDSILIGIARSSFIIPDSICEKEIFKAINTTIPYTTNFIWRFGDGNTSTDSAASKSYATSGSYIIKLITDFGSCRDTATKTINVIPKPVMGFNSSATNSCSAPFSVQFTNISTGGIRYMWHFGDGDSSDLENPIHIYTKEGSFSVKLVVTNASGCSDSIRKQNYIAIAKPKIEFYNVPKNGCAPLNFSPSYAINTLTPITGYWWDFGDGTTSTVAIPTHTYTTPGLYDIAFAYTTADGCTDTLYYKNAVKVGQRPVADFDVMPKDACASTAIQFINKSSSNSTNYFWFFGDGGADTTRNPLHLYRDTGYFTITLIASNNGCTDTIKKPRFVHIKPPVAKFGALFNCNNPYKYFFTDRSIGATSRIWDFGDGTTSTVKNPVHTYAAPGTYLVVLTVSNDTCTHSTSYYARIIDENPDFTASTTSICKGDSLTLEPFNYNSRNIVYYLWKYNNKTDTARNPKISINKAGLYSITLITTNTLGCRDTITKINYITVNGPTANFGAINKSACYNNMPIINFNDSSLTDGRNAIVTWTWNFGDGVTQTFNTPPFSHYYSNPGFYNVSLKITDAFGCSDTIKKTNHVYISDPKASFFSPDTLSCKNSLVRFINTSQGPSIRSIWDFGDGATGIVNNTTHRYFANGVYDIKLTITDGYGCKDSVTLPTYINIDEPKALFTMSDSVGTCPPLIVRFTNQSTYFKYFDWNFGDGTGSTLSNPEHYYNYPGTYYARLIVISPGGCADTLTKKIVVEGPTGILTYDKTDACKPADIQFKAITQNTSSFIWDYNDGETYLSTDSIVTHTYSSMGVYVPRMILEDLQGCKVPIIGKDTIRIFGVDAAFNASKTLLCDSGLVIFSDNSIANDQITLYQWEFGDGNTSNQKNPEHTYSAAGIYAVQLITTTVFGCTDTSKQITDIKVVHSPQVLLKGDSGACTPANITVFGEDLLSDTTTLTWLWDFGNGTSSDLQNPPAITYPEEGDYTISMTVTNSSGCITTRTKTVTAYPLPKTDAGLNTTICENQTTTLEATGASTYTWSPTPALSCTDCAITMAAPATDMMFYVTGKTNFGCEATDSVFVRVKHPFVMQVGPGDTLCKGESFKLFAGDAENYEWSPAIGLDNAFTKNPVARPQQTTNYRVIGYDSMRCFYDTGYVQVVVYPVPIADAGKDVTISVGTNTQLNATVADASNYQWRPAVGLSCVTCPNPVATPKQTTTYKLTAVNQGGCVTTDEVTIYVVCNNGNVYFPNTFSPNGDGNNDLFYPRGTGLYNIKSMRVFNRWGETLFEQRNFTANDATKAWNGNYKGQPVPNDVYVYTVEIVCENQQVLLYSGNIAIIR